MIIILSLILLPISLALSEDRYIAELKDEQIKESINNKIVEEINLPNNLNQVAKARIGLSKKKIVLENISREILESEDSIINLEPDYKVHSLGEDIAWNYESIGLKSFDNNGEGISIAVLDTGVNYNLLSIIKGYDFVNEDNDPLDDNGHGTIVTQVLKNPGTNFPLVKSQIYSVKVLDEKGEGYISDVIEGINWAIENKVNIVLMSLGGEQDSIFLKETIIQAYNQGILIIAASGNENESTLSYPARYQEVIGVGSVNINLNRSKFSNYGPDLDFVAPGEEIIVFDGENYLEVQGTSLSVPHAGIVATAYWSDNKNLTNLDIIKKLENTSIDLGDKGRDDFFGWGLVRYEKESQSKEGAIIKGAVYEVKETASNDINIPFEGAILGFTFEDNETINLATNNMGEFELIFNKNITKIDVKENNCTLFTDSTLLNKNENKSIIISIYNKNKCSNYSSQAINNFADLGLSPEYPNTAIYGPFSRNLNKRPVLLIHGWSNEATSNSGDWGDLEFQLKWLENYEVWKLQYYPANLSNKKNAGIIRNQINNILSNYSLYDQLDVISHSMGVLGTRGYIQDMALSSSGLNRLYNNDIRRYVILAGPMYGSYLANIVDNSNNKNQLSSDSICTQFIKKHNIGGGTEATKDMEIGSDFTWDLNNQPINKAVQYLTISGISTLDNYITSDSPSDYCLSNKQESNDGIVSVRNSNLLSEGYPEILLNYFHSNIEFLGFGPDGIEESIMAGKIASLFFKSNLNYASANPFISQLNGEAYYSLSGQSDSLPSYLNGRAGLIVNVSKSEILLNDTSIFLLSNQIYNLERNTNSGKYYYVNLSHKTGQYLNYFTSLSVGNYEVFVNGKNSTEKVNIDPYKINLIKLNFDKDEDNFDSSKVGGSDCNDNSSLINPRATEICDNFDNDCNNLIDEIELCQEILKINSPLGGIHNDKRINLNITLNRIADKISYIDNSDDRPREKVLCSRNCMGYGHDRPKALSFDEGPHNLTIITYRKKTIDKKEINFLIDSTEPKISKTLPRGNTINNGSGFYIKYTENNCKNLTLKIYGTTLNITEEYSCQSGINIKKFINEDLSFYNNQEIRFQFIIEDIANNIKESRKEKIIIDTSKPIINSFTNLINGRRVILTLNITEINFDEVNYIDYNEVRPTTKNLCSSLRKGICSTSKTFRQGSHNLTISILDKAGNTEQKNLVFNI